MESIDKLDFLMKILTEENEINGKKYLLKDDFEKFFVEHFGYPASTRIPIALAEVACIVLLLIPRTCVLGAVLLTGYMGGAMATHIRVGEPWFVQFFVGVVGWLTVYCRVPGVRRVLPIRALQSRD